MSAQLGRKAWTDNKGIQRSAACEGKPRAKLSHLADFRHFIGCFRYIFVIAVYGCVLKALNPAAVRISQQVFHGIENC